MTKVDGNEVGTWDGFIYIIWGDKARTICHTASGDESDTFISLNDCLTLVGFAEGEESLDNVIVILEDFMRGTVYRYNNYDDNAWYECGYTEGFA
jgi:hypothetical protein